MTTNFLNQNTKTINTTAIQLAAIDGLYDYAYDTLQDMREYLTLVVFDAILKPYFLRHKIQVLPADVIEAFNDLANKIDKKAAALKVCIYDPCPIRVTNKNLPAGEQHAKKSSSVARSLHPDTHVRNTNLVLGEVARDLCQSVSVIRFRPIYDNGDISARYEDVFDTVIEIKVCDKLFTASMYDDLFYPTYSISPRHHQQHFLLGRCDEGYDVTDPDDGYFPPIDPDASNVLVLSALKRLCVHEHHKCVNNYRYEQALKNPVIVKYAKILSEFLGVSAAPVALFIKKAQKAEQFKEDDRADLRASLTVAFNHLIDEDSDIDHLMGLLSGMDNGNGYEGDYSAKPIV